MAVAARARDLATEPERPDDAGGRAWDRVDKAAAAARDRFAAPDAGPYARVLRREIGLDVGGRDEAGRRAAGWGGGDVARRQELELLCNMLGQTLGSELDDSTTGPPIGFALLLYDFGPNGFCAYTGNGNREDTIRLLREHLKMLETRTQ